MRPKSKLARYYRHTKQWIIAQASLERVIVNVSGADFGQIAPPMWIRRSSADVPPSQISASVPRGSNRLVQVLLVFQDDINGSNAFYYGESTFAADADSVNADVATIATSVGQGNGQIVGRYLNADGSGPTGKLIIRYNPGAGKHTMDVDYGDIYVGWFSAFALQNQALDYVFEDGSFLFQSATTMSLTVLGNSQVRAYVPATFRCNGQNCSSRAMQGNQQYVLGWFGPGGSAKTMCYDANTAKPIPGAFVDSTTAQLRNWNGNAPVVSDLAAGVGGVQTGGVGTTNYPSAACAGTAFIDNLYLDSSQIVSGDSVLGFSGPFQAQTSGGMFRAVSSSTDLTINWTYLPSVTVPAQNTGKLVLGSSLFFKLVAAGTSDDSHDLNCNSMNDQGFSYLSDFAAPAQQAVVTPAMVGLTAAQFSASLNQLRIALCPYFAPPQASGGERYFSKALTVDGYSMIQNKIASRAATNVNQSDVSMSYATQCLQYNLTSYDGSGNLLAAPAGSPVSIQVQSSGVGTIGFFPTAASCASSTYLSPINTFSGTQTVFSIAATTSSVPVFIKTANPGFFNIFINSQNGANFYQPSNVNFGVYSSSSVASLVAAVDSQNSLQVIGQCYPVDIQFQTSSQPAISSTSISFTLAFSGGSTLSGDYFSDGNCTPTSQYASPSSSLITVPAGATGQRIYFRPSAVGSGQIQPFWSSVGQTSSPTLNVGTADIVNIQVHSSSGPMYVPNACLGLWFEPLNSVGAQVQVSNPPSLNLTTTTGGAFYSDSSCSSAGALGSSPTVSMYFPGGNYPVYVMEASPTSSSIPGNDSAGHPIVSGVLNAITATITGPTNAETGCCQVYGLYLSQPFSIASTLQLSSSVAGGNFYDASDINCVSPLASTLITSVPANTSSLTFRFRHPLNQGAENFSGTVSPGAAYGAIPINYSMSIQAPCQSYSLSGTSGFGLSNNACTASNTAAFGVWSLINPSLALPIGGKYYFEFRIEGTSATSNASLGIGLAGATIPYGYSSNTAAAYYTQSGICRYSSLTPTCPPAAPGDIVGVAVDASTGDVAFALNGVWIPSSPTFNATNFIGQSVYIGIAMTNSAVGSNQVTLVTRGMLSKYPSPPGYSFLE